MSLVAMFDTLGRLAAGAVAAFNFAQTCCSFLNADIVAEALQTTTDAATSALQEEEDDGKGCDSSIGDRVEKPAPSLHGPRCVSSLLDVSRTFRELSMASPRYHFAKQDAEGRCNLHSHTGTIRTAYSHEWIRYDVEEAWVEPTSDNANRNLVTRAEDGPRSGLLSEQQLAGHCGLETFADRPSHSSTVAKLAAKTVHFQDGTMVEADVGVMLQLQESTNTFIKLP